MSDISLRYLLFGEDKTASKAVKGVGTQAVSTSNVIGGAFNKLGGAIGGELGDVLNKVGDGLDGLAARGKKMGAGLEAGGGALTGIGAALTMIGSKEKQASDQLNQAITDSGHVAGEYAEEIEKVVKQQENYGHSAADTKEALRVLTQATGDPKRALADMGTVANVAAAKHLSLADTAGMLAKVYGGAGKVLKEFNIKVDSTKAASAALAAAQKQEAAASDAQTKARGKYNTMLETSAVVAKMSVGRLQRMIDYGRAAGETDGELAKKTGLSVSAIIRLRQASDAVSAAHDKYRKSVNNLDVAQERNRKATHAAQDAIDKLGQKTRGQAAAAVDNWRGKIGVVVTKLGDWAGAMGQKVGPALTVLGPLLATSGALMQMVAARNAAAAVAQTAEATATSEQAVAQTGAGIAAKGWAAAQWLLNAALDANPIALVVVAIAALVAAFIVAWKHSETFRHIVTTAIGAVAGAFEAVWGWLKRNWPLLLGILLGPIGIAVVEIIKHWDGIVSFFKSIPGKIASAARGMWNFIVDEFKAVIDGVIRMWNGFVDHLNIHINQSMPWPIPDVHINLNIGDALKITPLATGGIVTRPTLALIGEAGPEAVIPLSGSGRGAMGGGTVHVHVNGMTRDGAREMYRALRELYDASGGRQGLAPIS